MTINVAIAGFGAIGQDLARRLIAGVPGFTLAAIGARDCARTAAIVRAVTGREFTVVPSADLHAHAGLILECAPTPAFRSIVEPAVRHGATVITVSGAALVENNDLVDVARAGGGRIVLATGAIGGLDALKAVRLGDVTSVTMVTRKPPKSLATAKYVVENRIDLAASEEPVRLFSGSALEAARAFPANVNVAAAVALAGIGPTRTRVEIWSDPALERNTHKVMVEGELARFSFQIENVPSQSNPGTGRITGPSMIAALIETAGALRIGT